MFSLSTFLQIERGKLHGCIDVGLSVMSVKKSTKCIDLDTEEQIYHLKVGLQGCYNLARKLMTLAVLGGAIFFFHSKRSASYTKNFLVSSD